MGIEDLFKPKKKTAVKVVKTLEQMLSAAPENVPQEDPGLRKTSKQADKPSWSKKREEDDWVLESSEHEDEEYPSLGASKPVDNTDSAQDVASSDSKTTDTAVAANIWATTKETKEEPIVPEVPANRTFVPSALRSEGPKPKVGNQMEFPTLETAAKDETVKPKPPPVETPESSWQTAGARYESAAHYTGRQNRNAEDRPFGMSRPRRDQAAEETLEIGWNRGQVVSKSNNEYQAHTRTHQERDGGSGFTRNYEPPTRRSERDSYQPGGFTRNTAGGFGRQSEPPVTSAGSWSRGQTIEASFPPTSRMEPSSTRIEHTQMQPVDFNHKNRFEALREIN